tara:strand:- start:7499 stop:8476 length:978 start_codon:yes stop_codon:yes gene_type:complete
VNKFILSFLLVLLASSCETDFNVNADWDEVTILYGLLDQSNDLQYVKINKAFLGQEDALLMASNSDSSNFEPNDLEITIYKIKTSSFNSFDTLGLVTLSDTSLLKDPGLFPTDNNIIYKFNNSSDFLNSNFVYSIKVFNKISGNVVSSSTRLIDGFNFETFNPSFDFGFYNSSIGYISKTLTWQKSNFGEIYQLDLIFNYIEGDDTIAVVWSQPLVESLGSNLMNSQFDGESFFNFLNSSIEINNNVIRRFFKLDIRMTVGTQELQTYINVNQPFSSIVQERPSYSNINNGIGLFSSRYTYLVEGIGLTNGTRSYIINDLDLSFQ